MQFEELTCSICNRQYSNLGDLIPRLLPECGHTFCTFCLNQLLKQQQNDFYCPEDKKARAEDFPKNFALLRLAEKTQAKTKLSQQNAQQSEQPKHVEHIQAKQPQSQVVQMESDLCPLHQRKLEIICITCHVRICSNCALFGPHKQHDIRMEAEVMNEISVRTECLMEMYELIKQNQASKVDYVQVEELYQTFNHRGVELKQQVKDKFKEIKAYIKIQEQQVETNLKKNLMKIEGQFKMIREAPKQLYEDAESWMSFAQVKLDNFIKHSSNPNFIAFDMLENKDAPPVIGEFNSKSDIIQSGEKILMQLDGQKDVSVQKIENYMSQLNVEFDTNAINRINEICKCELIENVTTNIDDSLIQDLQKQATTKPPLYASQSGVSQKPSTQQVLQKTSVPISESDMIISGMLFYLMFMASLHTSQSKSSQVLSPSVSGGKKKITTILEKVEEQKTRYGTYVAPQSSQTLLDSPKQDKSELHIPETQEESSNPEQNEEIDEGLINDIENYLKEVMEHNEEVMDISETPIGNYGAKCVAAVITLCDQLKEIRLSGCNIKDEGAIAIFDELKSSESVTLLDLNNNEITERCFDSLIQLLNTNKFIERIELKGLIIKNKFSLNKLKRFGERVVS